MWPRDSDGPSVPVAATFRGSLRTKKRNTGECHRPAARMSEGHPPLSPRAVERALCTPKRSLGRGYRLGLGTTIHPSSSPTRSVSSCVCQYAVSAHITESKPSRPYLVRSSLLAFTCL